MDRADIYLLTRLGFTQALLSSVSPTDGRCGPCTLMPDPTRQKVSWSQEQRHVLPTFRAGFF